MSEIKWAKTATRSHLIDPKPIHIPFEFCKRIKDSKTQNEEEKNQYFLFVEIIRSISIDLFLNKFTNDLLEFNYISFFVYVSCFRVCVCTVHGGVSVGEV